MPSFDIPMRNAHHKANVGWDQEKNTYFLHIMDMSKEEDDQGYDVLCLGGRPNEVWDLETIDGAVRAYNGNGLPNSIRLEMYRAANC